MVSYKCVNSSFDAFNEKLPKVMRMKEKPFKIKTFGLYCVYTTYMIIAPKEI